MSVTISQEDWTKLQQCWSTIYKRLTNIDDKSWEATLTDVDNNTNDCISTINKLLFDDESTSNSLTYISSINTSNANNVNTGAASNNISIENVTSQEFDNLMNQIENESASVNKDVTTTKENDFNSLPNDEKEFISNPVCIVYVCTVYFIHLLDCKKTKQIKTNATQTSHVCLFVCYLKLVFFSFTCNTRKYKHAMLSIG